MHGLGDLAAVVFVSEEVTAAVDKVVGALEENQLGLRLEVMSGRQGVMFLRVVSHHDEGAGEAAFGQTGVHGGVGVQVQVDGRSLDLGTVVVQAADRMFEVPPVGHPLSIVLGDQVELLGYDLSGETVAPGETLTLTLYWRALTEMDESYTVFTHLVAPDGSMAGQCDNPPVGGSYPTNLWLAGEVVTDVYEIAISADAAPGEHLLVVGMYVAETGARLPVSGESGDAVVLQTITLAE